MTFLNESMQAVVLLVCEAHAPQVQEKLNECPEGNWFVMPSASSCRSGYWPHVSQSHANQGIAIMGFIERQALARQLQKFATINQDGSLCPDCVAYEWGITPSHIVETTTDPVCKRSISVANAATLQYDGRLYAFCSIGCRDRFQQSPTEFVHDEDASNSVVWEETLLSS